MVSTPSLRSSVVRRRLALATGAALVLLASSGCGLMGRSTPEPPAGPAATVVDTSLSGGTAGQLGDGGGLFFYVTAVNRIEPANNALDATLKASAGTPAAAPLRFQATERQVPAGPVRLRLKGTVGFSQAMPVWLRLTGGSDSVEGEVDVQLEPGKRYRVNGWLDATRREVWLEDENHEVVGAKVSGRVPRVPDPVAPDTDIAYTCCNLRYEAKWISDANEFGHWFIPAGARIQVKSYGRHHAEVLINGKAMTLAQDYGGKHETLRQYTAKLIVRDDPRVRLATWAPELQAAIGAGKLLPGMTREQVMMSLGPPRADATPSMTSARWRYWLDTDEEIDFSVFFGADGLVQTIDADAHVRERLVYRADAAWQ